MVSASELSNYSVISYFMQFNITLKNLLKLVIRLSNHDIFLIAFFLLGRKPRLDCSRINSIYLTLLNKVSDKFDMHGDMTRLQILTPWCRTKKSFLKQIRQSVDICNLTAVIVLKYRGILSIECPPPGRFEPRNLDLQFNTLPIKPRLKSFLSRMMWWLKIAKKA